MVILMDSHNSRDLRHKGLIMKNMKKEKEIMLISLETSEYKEEYLTLVTLMKKIKNSKMKANKI